MSNFTTLRSFFTRWNQKTGLEFTELAKQTGIQQEIIDALRGGSVRYGNNGHGKRIPAELDKRYIKLHAFFEEHDLPGFLDAARKVQEDATIPGNAGIPEISSTRMNLLDMLLHLWRTFRNDRDFMDETAWLTLLRYEKGLDDDDRADVLAKTVTLFEESTRTDTLLVLWKLLPRNASSEVKTAYLKLLDNAKELDEAEDDE